MSRYVCAVFAGGVCVCVCVFKFPLILTENSELRRAFSTESPEAEDALSPSSVVVDVRQPVSGDLWGEEKRKEIADQQPVSGDLWGEEKRKEIADQQPVSGDLWGEEKRKEIADQQPVSGDLWGEEKRKEIADQLTRRPTEDGWLGWPAAAPQVDEVGRFLSPPLSHSLTLSCLYLSLSLLFVTHSLSLVCISLYLFCL